MGNIVGGLDTSASLKTSFDSDKSLRDTSLDLTGGDTSVKKNLIVNGTSNFKDNITLLAGKTINGIDVGTLSTNLGTLQTSVTGMGSAVSGDFAGKAITTTGLGTFGSVKTSDIDLNGNITSTTGKNFVIADSTIGLKITNGLAATNSNYVYQSFDPAGTITLGGKSVTIGTGAGASGKVAMNNGIITAGSLTIGSGISDFGGYKFITPSQVKYGTTTLLNDTSLTVPTITTTGLVTSKGIANTGDLSNTGNLTNTGALNNTGALKLGSKWLINEVVDATKGTRLCFGSENAGVQTYWTCMNNVGNLERF